MSYWIELKFINENGDNINLSIIDDHHATYAILDIAHGAEDRQKISVNLNAEECGELSKMFENMKWQILEGNKIK